MPRKIRQLVRELVRSGFSGRRGKGSHHNFIHAPSGTRVTISGKDGDDAKPYQEEEVRNAISQALRADEKPPAEGGGA